MAKTDLRRRHPGWPLRRSVSCGGVSAATSRHRASSAHRHRRHLAAGALDSTSGRHLLARGRGERPVHGELAGRRLEAGLLGQSHGAPVLRSSARPDRLLLDHLLRHLDQEDSR